MPSRTCSDKSWRWRSISSLSSGVAPAVRLLDGRRCKNSWHNRVLMSRIVKVAALMEPQHLWSRSEVRARPCPVPRVAGVYAWYFLRAPAGVLTEDCHQARGATLLYVGISPKPPPANGSPPSRQTLRGRVRYHFSGNSAGSTLRLTLGCLLAESLGIELRRVGGGQRRYTQRSQTSRK